MTSRRRRAQCPSGTVSRSFDKWITTYKQMTFLKNYAAEDWHVNLRDSVKNNTENLMMEFTTSSGRVLDTLGWTNAR